MSKRKLPRRTRRRHSWRRKTTIGLRLSEITGLRQQDVSFGSGAHVRCQGKGRKERCTPLARSTTAVLNAWIEEEGSEPSKFLFPNARGGRLSADAVQHIVAKYVAAACKVCPSLAKKRVTPHVLRHYLPFLTMSGSEEPLRIWVGDSRSRSAKPRTLRDIVLCAVTGCLGTRGVGCLVHRNWLFPAEKTS